MQNGVFGMTTEPKISFAANSAPKKRIPKVRTMLEPRRSRRQTEPKWPARTQKTKQTQQNSPTRARRKKPKRGKGAAVAKGLATPEATKQAIYLHLKANKKAIMKREYALERLCEMFGVSISVVRVQAARLNIFPPQGRPAGAKDKGERKKYKQRSPHRERAKKLKENGLSLQEIADKITEEVHEAGDKEFKISREAIRQLLLTDGTEKKKK